PSLVQQADPALTHCCTRAESEAGLQRQELRNSVGLYVLEVKTVELTKSVKEPTAQRRQVLWADAGRKLLGIDRQSGEEVRSVGRVKDARLTAQQVEALPANRHEDDKSKSLVVVNEQTL